MQTITLTPTLTPPSITLTDEQQTAINSILAWFNGHTPMNHVPRHEFKLGGYAGTGKTTIINYLLTEITSIRANVCAFTGKACHVLRKKGIHSSQTIHSMIYDCEENKDGSVSFVLKRRLEGNPNLIIIDEASMLSSDLYRDLLTFNIPLLFIGDPGQLEPVGDNPNLMLAPNYVLTKIHRQALNSPIITLATQVRQGFPVKITDPTGACLVKAKFITDEELSQCSQVICAKNATRSILNRRIRTALGRVDAPLNLGEKLICLRNNRRYAMFNGLICYVEDFTEHEHYWLCTLRDEGDKIYHSIRVWKKPFLTPLEKLEQPPRDMLYFDYGYAITCHKSQGSEWPHVLVYDEIMFKTDMKRWRYTAITRASEKLTYCI